MDDNLVGWNMVSAGLPMDPNEVFLVYGQKLGSCWKERVHVGTMFTNRGTGIRAAGERNYHTSQFITHWKYVKQGFNEFNMQIYPTEMDFLVYQQLAAKTAIYPNRFNNLNYPALGLASEAGEVAGKVKKVMRDFNGVLTDNMRLAIIKELGDCLWYVAAICDEIKTPMNIVAKLNIEKLSGRAKSGTLAGDGDNR